MSPIQLELGIIFLYLIIKVLECVYKCVFVILLANLLENVFSIQGYFLTIKVYTIKE